MASSLHVKSSVLSLRESTMLLLRLLFHSHVPCGFTKLCRCNWRRGILVVARFMGRNGRMRGRRMRFFSFGRGDSFRFVGFHRIDCCISCLRVPPFRRRVSFRFVGFHRMGPDFFFGSGWCRRHSNCFRLSFVLCATVCTTLGIGYCLIFLGFGVGTSRFNENASTLRNLRPINFLIVTRFVLS